MSQSDSKSHIVKAPAKRSGDKSHSKSLLSARIVGFVLPPLAPPIADGRRHVPRAQLGELLGGPQDFVGTRATADKEIGLRRMAGDRHKAWIVHRAPLRRRFAGQAADLRIGRQRGTLVAKVHRPSDDVGRVLVATVWCAVGQQKRTTLRHRTADLIARWQIRFEDLKIGLILGRTMRRDPARMHPGNHPKATVLGVGINQGDPNG